MDRITIILRIHIRKIQTGKVLDLIQYIHHDTDMVLLGGFFTIKRIPILRNGYRDRFPFLDIFQIPVTKLDIYKSGRKVSGITLCREIWIGIQDPFQSHIQTIQYFLITRIGYDIIGLRIICSDHPYRIVIVNNATQQQVYLSIH